MSDRFVPAPGQLVVRVLDAALAPWGIGAGAEVLVDAGSPAAPGRPALAAVAIPGGGTAWRAQALDAPALAGLAVLGPVVAVRRGWTPA